MHPVGQRQKSAPWSSRFLVAVWFGTVSDRNPRGRNKYDDRDRQKRNRHVSVAAIAAGVVHEATDEGGDPKADGSPQSLPAVPAGEEMVAGCVWNKDTTPTLGIR